jgi:Putative cyclase
MPQSSAPSFDSLRIDPNGPPGNAWGRFGANDHLGMLNLLTPDVVAEAANEIRSGVRVSLDWPLNKPLAPSFGRDRLQHRIIHKSKPDDPNRPVHDDVVTFNTQSSSQWDGFRHYGHAPTSKFYNGTTLAEIQSGGTKIGIDAIASAGGIVGRGVLIDYARWADENGVSLAPFESKGIPLDMLLKAATAQGVTFRSADILVVRSGFTRAYDALSEADQEALPRREKPSFQGVLASEAMVRWLWETQFAAVAGDAVAFEASPPGEGDPQYSLHQWLLPRWGMREYFPISSCPTER